MTRNEFLSKEGYYLGTKNRNCYFYEGSDFKASIDFSKEVDPIEVDFQPENYWDKTPLNRTNLEKINAFYKEVEKIYKKALKLEPPKKSAEVIVYNYYSFKVFPSREVALKEYSKALAGSDGSEKERYANIVSSLIEEKDRTLYSNLVYVTNSFEDDLDLLSLASIETILDYAKRKSIKVEYFKENN